MAVRESMRPTLNRDAEDPDERVVLGKVATERKDAAKPPRVVGALITIVLIFLTLLLAVLVPMFRDIF